MNILLIAFGIFVLFFIIHTAVIVYHIMQFSVYPEQGRFLAIAIAVVSVMLLILAVILLTRINWNASFGLNPGGGLL